MKKPITDLAGDSSIPAGDVIDLAEAVSYTHGYQLAHPDAIYSYTVSKEKVDLLLRQADCASLRIYNGLNPDDGRTCVVLVGVDSNGNDMTDGVIIERLVFCPPKCRTSVLIAETDH